MIRVLVIASSVIMRTGLEQMIAAEPDFHVVLGGRNGRVDAQLPEDEQPDVVIAEMEGGDGEEWSEVVDLNGPAGAFLLLVDDPASSPAAEAIRAGAKGVLPKRLSQEELVAAVHAVAAGLVVMYPEGASAAIPSHPPAQGRFGSLVEPLTAREKEVLSILAEGGSNKEIATRLSISEHTAKFHVSSIIGKLGATSRTEAVTLAIRQGIIMV